MEQDLVVRGLSAQTRRIYRYAVADLARYHHRSPDQLSDRDVQQYVRHLIEERRLAWASCRVMVSGVRFFYEVTLGRPRATFSIPLPKGARKLPQILSRAEVTRLLEGVPNRKHRALLMTTYAAGLRGSEVTRLRVTDIDSHRMVIRVAQGKGRKDRYTLLSPRLLDELRRYYRVYRPTEWLFPRPATDTPLAPSTAAATSTLVACRRSAGQRIKRMCGCNWLAFCGWASMRVRRGPVAEANVASPLSRNSRTVRTCSRKASIRIGRRPIIASPYEPLPSPSVTRPGASPLIVPIESTIEIGARSGAAAM
jgi:site-specific recombinase XerD